MYYSAELRQMLFSDNRVLKDSYSMSSFISIFITQALNEITSRIRISTHNLRPIVIFKKYSSFYKKTQIQNKSRNKIEYIKNGYQKFFKIKIHTKSCCASESI